jgi:hypothetical protein
MTFPLTTLSGIRKLSLDDVHELYVVRHCYRFSQQDYLWAMNRFLTIDPTITNQDIPELFINALERLGLPESLCDQFIIKGAHKDRFVATSHDDKSLHVLCTHGIECS